MDNGAVYWIGQDGNIWVKDSGGTRNAGPAGASVTRPDATGFYDPWADLSETPIRFNATQIADPMVQQQTSAPAAGGGAAPKVFNQAGADNTQRTIDQIPGLLQAALAAESTSHNNVVSGFDAADQAQQKQYGDSTVTNQQNYDSNFMDSIRAGIKGLGGLMALLRGTGAGGGTAEDLARDTVGGVTSNDIRTGADTQKENQGALDSSLSTFLTDLKGKRTAAEDTFQNNNRAINRDSNTQLQDLFGKMAGFYGDVGNQTAANQWMGYAGNLTPDIAANSKTVVSPYDTSPVVVHAPNLTAFAGPTQPSVTAPDNGNGQVGAGLFSMTDPRRRKDAPVAPAPALAGV